jgi:hypothetical protein
MREFPKKMCVIHSNLIKWHSERNCNFIESVLGREREILKTFLIELNSSTNFIEIQNLNLLIVEKTFSGIIAQAELIGVNCIKFLCMSECKYSALTFSEGEEKG